LFIGAIITLWALKQLTPLYTLFFLSGSAILVFLLIVIYLKPKFHLLHKAITEIQAENIRYGIHLYFGRVVDVSTYQLDRLMIAFFVNATEVGFYSLAMAMASPLQTFTYSLASSKFKSFSNRKQINRELLWINYLWITIGGLSALILGYFIVYHILGVEYYDVFLLFNLLIIAVAFQSGYQAYNAWLASNGEGMYMKRKSFYTAFANIVLNIILIPIWGAVGAAIASIISMAISYWLHLFFYQKSLLKGSVSV